MSHKKILMGLNYGDYEIRGYSIIENNTILSAATPFTFLWGDNLFNSENWYNNMKAVRPNTVLKEIVNGKEYIKFKPDGLGETRENVGNLKTNTQYTVSFYGFNENRTSSGLRFYYDDGTYSNAYIESTTEREYSLTSTAGKTIVSIGVPYNYNDYVFIRNIMLTEGTSPKPYEKYRGKTFNPSTPVVLRRAGGIADTYRNTTGKKMTRVYNITLNGNEAWNTSYLEQYKCLILGISQQGAGSSFSTNLGIVIGWGSSAKFTIQVGTAADPFLDRWASVDTFRNDCSTKLSSGSPYEMNYELANPTTETYSSLALAKGVTHIYDAHGIELDFVSHN